MLTEDNYSSFLTNTCKQQNGENGKVWMDEHTHSHRMSAKLEKKVIKLQKSSEFHKAIAPVI